MVTPPAQFVNPLAGAHWGPGAETFLIDNTFGPFPIDDQLLIYCLNPQNPELEAYLARVNPQSNQWYLNWLVPDGVTSWTQASRDFFKDNEQVTLRARRVHANGQLVWETTVPVIWQNTNFNWQYGFQLLNRPTAQGGFGAADRDLLHHVDDGIWRNFPSG
jgi:hypothetical protein